MTARQIEISHRCDKEAEISSIQANVAEIRSGLASLPTAREYGALTGSMDGVRKAVDELVDAMHGNGKPGLKTEVALNTEFRNKALWLAGLVAVQIVTNLGLIVQKAITPVRPAVAPREAAAAVAKTNP